MHRTRVERRHRGKHAGGGPRFDVAFHLQRLIRAHHRVPADAELLRQPAGRRQPDARGNPANPNGVAQLADKL